jgi:hypothetical protein
MSDESSPNQQKVMEYFRVIQERILLPIEKTEIREFCTATLLLLFAAIDGLGGLLHSRKGAGSNARIRRFLEYMGADYSAKKSQLLALRNFLVHSAISAESFLSKTEMGCDHHLKTVGAAGFMYVNTSLMYDDFIKAFVRFRADIESDSALMNRAADRLEWRDDQAWNEEDGPQPSPPPPVEFIFRKGDA